MSIGQKIAVKVYSIILQKVFLGIERFDITTKALERAYKIKQFRLVWPNFINAVISFLRDCIKEAERARKWYEQ